MTKSMFFIINIPCCQKIIFLKWLPRSTATKHDKIKEYVCYTDGEISRHHRSITSSFCLGFLFDVIFFGHACCTAIPWVRSVRREDMHARGSSNASPAYNWPKHRFSEFGGGHIYHVCIQLEAGFSELGKMKRFQKNSYHVSINVNISDLQ